MEQSRVENIAEQNRAKEAETEQSRNRAKQRIDRAETEQRQSRDRAETEQRQNKGE
jgi:hypothetical protein